ncbi:MAG: gfo/Idh/MocA family oxidoreductase, partial [Nitrospinota bacterium]
ASADTLQRDIAVEDTLVATLRFASGALATITATTTAAPGFPHRIEIYGTEGGIQVEGESLVRWESTGSSRPAGERTTGGTPVSAGAGADPRGIAPTGHIAIVRDFIQALRTARPPFIDGREGCRSLRTILQIYQAAGLPSPQRRA